MPQPQVVAGRDELFVALKNRAKKTTCDVDVAGRVIPKGSKSALMVTTDNRAAAVVDNADTMDVDHKPNRHIAMDHGIHRCVGVALARAQPRVAVGQLLAMTDEFAVSSWSHLGSSAADALRAPNNPRLSPA